MTKPLTTMLMIITAVLFIALLLRGGEVLTALAISTTNSSSATVNITTSQSTCEPATCYDVDDTTDYIDLLAGDQRYVKCNTTCNNNNGWGNIMNYTGTIGTSGVSCTPADNTKCYQNNTCQNTSAVNITAQKVTCSYLIWYNADNTSKSGQWTGGITSGEVGGSVSVPATDTIGVQELLALGVDGVLSFGAKSAAVNDSVTGSSHNLYNYGNIQMDFQVNGSDMACAVSSIPAEYIKASLSAATAYSAAYSLTAALGGPDTGGKFGSFNLDENNTVTTQNPQAPQKASYWGIGIPSGVLGSCQGTIWFAAVAS